MRHARQLYVVEIAALAGDETEIFLAPDALAGKRRHGLVHVFSLRIFLFVRAAPPALSYSGNPGFRPDDE
jgi:hypothetical protein